MPERHHSHEKKIPGHLCGPLCGLDTSKYMCESYLTGAAFTTLGSKARTLELLGLVHSSLHLARNCPRRLPSLSHIQLSYREVTVLSDFQHGSRSRAQRQLTLTRRLCLVYPAGLVQPCLKTMLCD